MIDFTYTSSELRRARLHEIVDDYYTLRSMGYKRKKLKEIFNITDYEINQLNTKLTPIINLDNMYYKHKDIAKDIYWTHLRTGTPIEKIASNRGVVSDFASFLFFKHKEKINEIIYARKIK